MRGAAGKVPDHDGPRALAFAALAAACLLIPVVGEYLAAPVGLLAVILGLREVGRYDQGLSSSLLPATLATTLGLAVLVICLLLFWMGLDPGA